MGEPKITSYWCENQMAGSGVWLQNPLLSATVFPKKQYFSCKASQLLSYFPEPPRTPGKSLGINRPHLRIDDARRTLAVERHDQLLGRDAPHVGARLVRHPRRVRARHHIVEGEQRMIGRWRLLVPHVEPGAGDLFSPQRVGERALVVDVAARGGDEIGVRLHQRERARADHAARALVERTVDRHEIGAPQELVELDLHRAAFRHRALVEIGIAGDHLHAEKTATELGHPAPDIAEPDDADGAASHIGAGELPAVAHGPAAQGVMGLDDPLGEHQQHGEHMRRHGFRIAAGLIDHEHAGARAVLQVDGVVARAVGRNDEEVRHARERFAPRLEARRQLVPGRADLIGVRRRHDRRRGLLGRVVLQPVEADLRALRDQIEVAGMREVADVEDALDVLPHRSAYARPSTMRRSRLAALANTFSAA